MAIGEAQLKKLGISSISTFNWMTRFGWVDYNGNPKEWHSFQRPNHDAQFAEERERKAPKKKFSKERQ